MIFVDASALVAIIAREPDAEALENRLRRHLPRFTSSLALYEAALGLARLGSISVARAESMLHGFLVNAKIEVTPITAETGRIAIDAFVRYGRGNHPARLNMGDCFAYACARSLSAPLLFKGEDFSQTDIAVA